jgi:hypothetical protein
MKHRRLGADVVWPEHEERHLIRPYCVSINLSDLIESRRGDNGVDQPAGAPRDPD